MTRVRSADEQMLRRSAVRIGVQTGAAVAVTLSAPAAPDVVPYPTVTGPLGDHLRELQKGVEP